MEELAVKPPVKSLIQYPAKIWESSQHWFENPWFAYLSILLLQIKRIWGIWLYKDLTTGDTSSYFQLAYGWAKEFSVLIEWSPLYTAFYGTLLKLFNDVYLTTILHRLIIVLMLAIMVLAVMRRLLPSSIAWLIAAWWAILPINFDSLYEVHLFAVLLPLSSVLLVLHRSNLWTRGGALGILLASVSLVRNEGIIALSLWSIVCLIWEWRQARNGQDKPFKAYFLAYGLPILLVVLVFGFFYGRTLVKSSPEKISRKHTLNVCQIYAFGYQQRNSDWTKSPWTECQDLMLRVFGKSEPSLVEALKANPSAMINHFFWNIRLVPAGLQTALFNATSESINPDYAPVLLNQPMVIAPSLLALVLIVIAFIKLLRQKQYWWVGWFKERIWGWAILFCLAAVMTVVIPMQRPRPSYMFLLTLFLMALVGTSLFITIRQLSIYKYMQQLSLMIMVGLFIFIPPYYSLTKRERPLLTMYRELHPSDQYLGIPGTGLVTVRYGQLLCHYLTKNNLGGCVGYTYSIFDNIGKNESVAQFLNRQSVPVVAIQINNIFLSRYGRIPSVKRFLANPERFGWKVAAMQNNSKQKWSLYVKKIKTNDQNP